MAISISLASASPTSAIATVQKANFPNQISRENGRLRIIVFANTYSPGLLAFQRKYQLLDVAFFSRNAFM